MRSCAPRAARALPRVAARVPASARCRRRGGALCGACLARPPPFARRSPRGVYAFPRRPAACTHSSTAAGSRWPSRSPAALVARRRDARDAPRRMRSSRCRLRRRGSASAASTRRSEIARRVARAHRPCRWSPGSRAHARFAAAGGAAVGGARAQRARRVRCATARSRAGASRIVDDVMTTGATLAAAARAARRAGARDVEAWVVARTLPPAAG